MEKKFILLAVAMLGAIETKTEKNTAKVVVPIPSGIKSSEDRTIGDFYQHGITQQICQKLTEEITKLFQAKKRTITILTTRPKTTFDRAFSQAEYVNKANPTVAIQIGIYSQPLQTPHIEIYSYSSLNKHERCKAHQHETLHLVPANHAHCKNFDLSSFYSNTFYNFFKSEEKKAIYKAQQFCLPFLPLKGIVPPAFGFEIGIPEPNGWQSILHDLAEAIVFTLESRDNV